MKKTIFKVLTVVAITSLALFSCDDNVDLVVPCDNGNLIFQVSYDTTAGVSVSDVNAGNSTVPLSDFDITIDGQTYTSAQLQNFTPSLGVAYNVCATYIPMPSCSECITYVVDSTSINNPGGGGNPGGGATGGSPSVVSSDCGTILFTAAIDSSVSNFQAMINAQVSGAFDWTLNGNAVTGAMPTAIGSSIDLQVVSGDVVCASYDCGNNMISQTCFTVQ